MTNRDDLQPRLTSEPVSDVRRTGWPELDRIADEIATRATLSLIRSAALRAGLPDVRAARDPDPFEVAADTLIDALTAGPRQRLEAAAERHMRATRSERAKAVGSLSRVDLAASASIGQQLESIPLTERLGVDGPALVRALRILATDAMYSPPRDARARIDTPGARPGGDGGRAHATPGGVARPRPASLRDRPETATSGVAVPGATDIDATGAIETKYLQLKGAAGPLGEKDGAPRFDRDHAGRRFLVQFCENGAIFLGPDAEAHAIWAHIFQHWQDLAGVDEPYLGIPRTDQRRTPNGEGWFCHFLGGGSIYFTPAFGAREVHGAIRAKWRSLGAEDSPLGFPKSDEQPTREPPPYGPRGALSRFDDGVIYWSPQHGAHPLPDPIDQIYQSMFAELGNLGYPRGTADDLDKLHPVNFEGGRITVKDGKPQLKALASGLAFKVRFVEAEATTKEIGKDEISLHLLGIDSLGQVSTQKQYLGEFNNGHVRENISPFPHFPIALQGEPHPWPRTFKVVATLSELDGVGFDAFIVQLVNAAKGAVDEILAKAAAAASGIPGVGIFLAALLGVVLPKALDKLWDWLKDSLKKDVVFEPASLSLTLFSVSNYPPPAGNVDNTPGWFILEPGVIDASAQGGHYRIGYAWWYDRTPALA